MIISLGTEILQEPDIRLLGQRLLNKEVVGHARLGKGRNSRCYHLQCVDENYVLKFYFQSPNDARDRLGVEFKALSFLWDHGVRSIPQAILMDRESRSAVYQYLAGAPLRYEDIGVNEINDLIDFLGKINELRGDPKVLEFGPASEACFSLGGIMTSIEDRLKRFNQVEGHKALRDFLKLEFMPLFTDARKWIEKTAGEYHIELPEELGKPERILSPSDVGFHNALRDDQGKIIFLDFEYFGWDDPAKLAVDFLLHPAMDLSDDLKIYYVRKVRALFPEQKTLKERIILTYPLFGLKWCLILLNEFIRDDSARRHFASEGFYDPAAIQKQQLEKARKIRQKIKLSYQTFPFFR